MFAGGSVGANVPTRTYSAAGAGADEGPAREKGLCCFHDRRTAKAKRGKAASSRGSCCHWRSGSLALCRLCTSPCIFLRRVPLLLRRRLQADVRCILFLIIERDLAVAVAYAARLDICAGVRLQRPHPW